MSADREFDAGAMARECVNELAAGWTMKIRRADAREPDATVAEALKQAHAAGRASGIEEARESFMRSDVGKVWTSYAAAEFIRALLRKAGE